MGINVQFIIIHIHNGAVKTFELRTKFQRTIGRTID